MGGGLDPCLNGLGHLFLEELSMFKGAFAWFGGSDGGNKVPHSARLSEGGGVYRYLGNAQIDPAFFEVGLP